MNSENTSIREGCLASKFTQVNQAVVHHTQKLSVMKVGKDHLISISHIFNPISNSSMQCCSIEGGYLLCIPVCDIKAVLV